jgi:hypothetical protein
MAIKDYIPDSALDSWYGRDWFGPDTDYFNPPDEDYDPDDSYIDDDEPYEKPSEREIPR